VGCTIPTASANSLARRVGNCHGAIMATPPRTLTYYGLDQHRTGPPRRVAISLPYVACIADEAHYRPPAPHEYALPGERQAQVCCRRAHYSDAANPHERPLACPKGELDLVFPNGVGRIENYANIVTRGLAPVQVAAGVVTKNGEAKYTGLHSLRHFYASWCINRRADGGLELPLKLVQHRLGHSTISMTADTYGHMFPTNDDGVELAAAQRALLGVDAT
jgi:integrase